jgi:hypothetical protein
MNDQFFGGAFFGTLSFFDDLLPLGKHALSIPTPWTNLRRVFFKPKGFFPTIALTFNNHGWQ